MTTIELHVETISQDLESELTGRNDWWSEETYHISVGQISVSAATIMEAVDPFNYVDFVLEAGKDISLGLIAAWIYDKLKAHRGSIRRIRINEIEVQLDRGEITRVIERTTEIDDCRR